MKRPRAKYRLEPETGSLVVTHYNWARPFSNFFPGIAGHWGIPMWAYYVNRGQGVCSAGVRDKNGQILEFQSFNLATARVAREGFRTFLRVDGKGVVEPFARTTSPRVTQTMVVSASELVLREKNATLGLEIEVTYFGLTNQPVAALARQVTIRNLRKKPRRLEWLDGASRVLPYGLDQNSIKNIARHIEGMMGVISHKGYPLFRLKQTAADIEQVELLHGGNFYLSPGAKLGKGMIVDPAAIFGDAQDLDHPWEFERGGLRAVLAAPNYRDNRTPCAYVARSERLPARGETKLTALLGHVGRDEDLDGLALAMRRPTFFEEQRSASQHVVEEIGQHAFTLSASPELDAYARQDFLDNVIRGGMPLVFDTTAGKSAFYVYSRQNGDLERDYHFFVLDPTYLSQGTGHYRSVLQNRRSDTWFFPEVEDANLKTFLNLIQLDGYNPLEVNGTSYRIEDAEGLAAIGGTQTQAALSRLPKDSFTPGELVMLLEEHGSGPADPQREQHLREVLALAVENEVGGLHEGFWVDHWHYNIDLLDTYAMVYPDRLSALLLERQDYTFFDDPDVILPRAQRSVDAGGRIRAYGAVVRDPEKVERIAAREHDAYRVRTRYGDGAVFHTTLAVKLLCIVTNRLATLDAAGVGIEMEAGKPGWNDSMNGLPGLFGSGLSETSELRRAVRFLLEHLPQNGMLAVYEELSDFLRSLESAIRERCHDGTALDYWHEANDLKEAYRERTRLGVAGAEVAMPLAEIREFLAAALDMLDRIFTDHRQLAVSAGGVPYTYFVNEVTESEPTGETNDAGQPRVEPRAFSQRPARLFLEGAVHWMKDRPEDAADIYEAVRKSKLFDRKLKMYKSCESMVGESHELGRAVGAYPRGWIENESIYLHMEYKYLLEILRSGLCKEFWRDAKTALIPFMDPAVYGRSTVEGASFIVSSAYAEPERHGQAFQPRLSGITCEMLHIWSLAVAGPRPFRLGADGDVELAIEPRLPDWLFTEKARSATYHDPIDGWRDLEVPKNSFAFKLLGHTLVVLHNHRRLDTFGKGGVGAKRYALTYRNGHHAVEVEGRVVPAEHAVAVRKGDAQRLDVVLGLNR